MTALITLTHRTVEHTDPQAAGFTDGYWWTLTTDDPSAPTWESATATREASERFARDLAISLGINEHDITIKVEDDLADRKADEQRVAALHETHRTAAAPVAGRQGIAT